MPNGGFHPPSPRAPLFGLPGYGRPFRLGDVSPGSPDEFSGLACWLRQDPLALLSDGATPATWPDSSPARNDGVASGTPTYRTNQDNGRSVLRFGGADYFQLPDLSALAAGTAFIVVKIDADPPGLDTLTGLWHFGTAAFSTHFPYTDGVIYEEFGSTVRKTTVDPSQSLSAGFHVYEVVSGPGDFRIYLDGALLYSTATNTVGFGTAPKIGKSRDLFFLDGDVGEFVLFDSVKPDVERLAVRSYLSAEFGIRAQVDATVSVAWEAGVGLDVSSSIPVEATQATPASVGVPYEAVGIVGATATNPWEATVPAQQATSTGWEASTGITRTLSPPFEATAVIAATGGSPWEAGGLTAGTASLPYEALTRAELTGQSPWEGTATGRSTATAPLEATGAASAQPSTPFEAAGQAQSSSSLPYEASARVQFTAQPPWEGVATGRATTTAPLEATGGAAAQPTLPFEAAGQAQASGSLPYESAARITVSGQGPWETLAASSTSTSAAWEAQVRAERGASANYEAAGWITATTPTPFETAGLAAAVRQSVWEAPARASVTASSPWESIPSDELSKGRIVASVGPTGRITAGERTNTITAGASATAGTTSSTRRVGDVKTGTRSLARIEVADE